MTDQPTLQWINERPEGTDEAVLADIAKSLTSLGSPELLGYHTVFLGDDMENSPGVIVTGEDGNPNFVCEFFPKIGDAFVTIRPNMDPETERALKELGLEGLNCEEIEAALSELKDKIDNVGPTAAIKAFLKGRGGKKSERSEEDHILGHNAIANRISENEQDKGA